MKKLVIIFVIACIVGLFMLGRKVSNFMGSRPRTNDELVMFEDSANNTANEVGR